MVTLSRHRFLRLAAAASLGVATSARSQVNAAPAPEAGASATDPPEVSKKAWMDKWIDGAKPVAGGLFLFRFKDPIWSLVKPIKWSPSKADSGKYKPVQVPVGFVTDLASIPPVFFSLLRPDGLYTYPAIVHDYLYWMQCRSKDAADEIFRLAMAEFDVPKWKLELIFAGVSKFGQSAWDKNAALKAGGEQRVLKKFPDDPLTLWDRWKAQPGVFVDPMSIRDCR